MTTNTSAQNARRHDSNQPTHTRVGALQQSHPGLCGTLVGPGKDTHGTPVPPWRKAVGGPTQAPRHDPPTNDNTTKTRSQDKRALSHQVLTRDLETYMVAEQRNDDHTDDDLDLSTEIEVETSWIIKKIVQRNGTNHPGEDHRGEDQPGDRVHQDSPESAHQVERDHTHQDHAESVH